MTTDPADPPAAGADPVDSATRSGPLAGVVVADLSTVLAGPYCTMLLGDLGADVVKVEPPEGDATRTWGPPWVTNIDGSRGDAAYYFAINRNKRAMRVDLKTPAGRDVVARLLARADVLVENYRVGGLARLGFPDAELERINPHLVHLAISGYGPDGPRRDEPGYDFIIQAVAGLMSITGAPDETGGEPTKVGVAIADLTTGMLGAVAVLAALAGRERAGSPAEGRGQRIDISLLEATISWLANQAQNFFATGVPPGRRGNRHPNITPYETFRTADGTIAVGVGSERQWPRFCAALGLAGLAEDHRFRTNGDRVTHRGELRALLDARFAERTTADWLARLAAADVPVGPINDLAAVFADPQVLARRMVETVEHPTAGPIRLTGIPFKLSATPAAIRLPPPLLGEQTEELLAGLGYAPDEIARLRADGVV